MAPPKGSYRDIDDGIVVGRVLRVKTRCKVCDQWGNGIEITNVLLPDSIPPSAHLIFFTGITTSLEDHGVLCDYASPIGITCGCYAKAHRQIAHITTRRKFNGKHS
jgi:hypothetical protein